MTKFKGFTNSESLTQLPDSFFHHLLNEIEDIAELKVTLYTLWRIENMEGGFHALCETDFRPADLGISANEISRGLEEAVRRESILRVRNDAEDFYFLNSPRGRATAEAFAQGQQSESIKTSSASPVERPNIFKLYEENIGPLTPLIADTLKDAEDLYPGEWISEAIELAVTNNKRSWKYTEAILKRWKEEGRGKKHDRRDDQKDNQSLDRKIEQLRKRSTK